MLRLSLPLVLLGLVAACATRPVAVVEAPPPPPPPAPEVPRMPAGGVAGMVIPARLADGGWPTPGRGLTADGAVWHLRAALNVAALSCRAEAETIVPAYNALISDHKAALAATQARYAAEWKAGGGDWQDRWDDAMTRAYNFYGQSFARVGFCAAAATTLADLATLPDDRLAAFAAERLPTLEQPFRQFFTEYAAWRDASAPVMAIAAPAPVPAAAPQVAVAVPAAKPWLRIDPAVYRMP